MASKLQTVVEEIAAELVGSAAFSGIDIHVVTDLKNGDGSIVEDAIALSVEEDGVAVVLRIDDGSNPFPNVPGPQLDPLLVAEVIFDPYHSAAALNVREWLEKVSSVVHLFVPSNGRTVFSSTPAFKVTEDSGLIIGSATFTTPSGVA